MGLRGDVRNKYWKQHLNPGSVGGMGKLIVPTQRNKPWTEEDDRLLMEMRATGRSTFSMCAALKRSAGAIKGRVAILRVHIRASADAIPTTLKDDVRLTHEREGLA